MKHLLGLAIAVLLWLLPNTSHANDEYGYLCNVQLMPSFASGTFNSYGSNGAILFDTYGSPNCGGSLIRSYVFCSTGSSTQYCSGYAYSNAELLTLFHSMVSQRSQQVIISAHPTTHAPYLITFH